MPRKRSSKIEPVKLKKLFLSPELKALAVGRAGGPMKITQWIIGVLEEFLSAYPPKKMKSPAGREYEVCPFPPDPGTGKDSLSLELPERLVKRLDSRGKFSSLVRRALHVATSEA